MSLTELEARILWILSGDDFGVWEVWGHVRSQGLASLEELQDTVQRLVKRGVLQIYKTPAQDSGPGETETVRNDTEWMKHQDWWNPYESNIHFYLSPTDLGTREYAEYVQSYGPPE